MSFQNSSLDFSDQTTACVTGATGMIGARIVQGLLAAGVRVKVLSRKNKGTDPRAQLVQGDLLDADAVRYFLEGADLLFHCAAELRDKEKMWQVNVQGTELLVAQARKVKPDYFCLLSSAGVVGETDQLLVDEGTPCNPQNEYEKSKLASEGIVTAGMDACRVVILRPTNVIDDFNPGPFNMALTKNFGNSLKLLLKGRECAHILHAEDVAEAALFFVDRARECGCFFVSRDDDEINSNSELWRLCISRMRGEELAQVSPPFSLPISVPFHLRRLLRGKGNRGNVRYSSRKLFAAGFEFSMSIGDMADKVIARSGKK